MVNLVFIGFMGAGKSAVGQAVARQLAWKFYDTDLLTLKLSNFKTINDIFDEKGENFFRQLEYQAVECLKNEQNIVISTGGGIVSNETAIELLKLSNACFIYLEASFEEILKRLRGNTSRPLFRDIEKAKMLYQSRLERYHRYADIVVNTDQYTTSEAAEKIIQLL